MKVKIKYVWFVTWLNNLSVTWLCGWGSLILSHHSAKFGVHRPCESESGDLTFFICHPTTISKCHVTFRLGPLILSHHPAMFRVHRPYGTGNNSVCNINFNSSSDFDSNSNTEVYKWPILILNYLKLIPCVTKTSHMYKNHLIFFFSMFKMFFFCLFHERNGIKSFHNWFTITANMEGCFVKEVL